MVKAGAKLSKAALKYLDRNGFEIAGPQQLRVSFETCGSHCDDNKGAISYEFACEGLRECLRFYACVYSSSCLESSIFCIFDMFVECSGIAGLRYPCWRNNTPNPR